MTSLSENTVVTTSGGLVELGYVTASTTVTITQTGGTTVGTTTGIVGPVTVVCDGSPIIVEFYTPYAYPAGITSAFINFVIFKDGAFAGFVGSTQTPAASADSKTLFFQWRDTPTAGIHTFEIRAYRDAGGGTAQAIGSVAAGWASTFIRVSKIIQASQFIVPLASAPLVTSLPSAPIDGQEIRYVADATNGIIWNLRYRAASSSAYKWEFVGGSGLYAQTLNSTGAISATGSSFVSAGSNNLSLNIDLPGEYTTIISGVWGGDSAGAWLNVGLSGAGFSPSDTDSLRFTAVSGSYYFSGSQSRTRTFTTTGTVSMVYRVSAGGAVFAERNMTFIPIRVKAP